jgi:hypothetical protein
MFKTERELQDAAFKESLRVDMEKAELKELADALAAVAAAKAKEQQDAEANKKEEKDDKKMSMEQLRAFRCAFFET